MAQRDNLGQRAGKIPKERGGYLLNCGEDGGWLASCSSKVTLMSVQCPIYQQEFVFITEYSGHLSEETHRARFFASPLLQHWIKTLS